ncbi:hypothetical protein K491DRAFT_744943 [Lophiostoma macrostomum CBS 122681]|uniref:protein-ribulosamine 3-kinase n=1 Tax=Lophiostoma macrostomum CBS 122681 TaxID=1314788 RepID=A0A6A6TT46_9PLEO|nr:hypothetical protein K491DRAFT_744943 [Lophiostoma macrostomum CBS 122681]
MSSFDEWEVDVEGNFSLNKRVVDLLPNGAKAISAVAHGTSNWTETAMLTVILGDGRPKNYYLKCARGHSARAITQGEFHSATKINTVVPRFGPTPRGWGQYIDGCDEVYFYLSDFHNMDLVSPPDPIPFITKLVQLHQRGTSPTGMFGYPIPTVIGKLQRTVTWEKSWAQSFTHLLSDAIQYDDEVNQPWPEFDIACSEIISVVIPRLLGALQHGKRNITPTLIHGDLWERNVGTDRESGRVVIFDPGSIYAHNEMEFGTWRCFWATHFKRPEYLKLYKEHIRPSEPAEEWDDRNRLYSIHAYLIASGGHQHLESRQLAYEEMVFLCENNIEGVSLYTPTLGGPTEDARSYQTIA